MQDAALLEKIRSKAYTPGAKEARALVGLLETVGKDEAADVVRALCRMGAPALALALEASASKVGPARARLLDVVGRLATAEDARATETLVAGLSDEHERVVKVAARALGRLGTKGTLEREARASIERALIAAKDRTSRPDLRATLIEALGKVGGSDALAALAEESDLGTARVTGRAKILLERETVRESESTIDPAAIAPSGVMVRFHCRDGLESILLEELGSRFLAKRSDKGLVEALMKGPLSSVFVARTATHVSFPIADRALAPGEELATAIAGELTSARSRALLTAFTRGRVRYRIEWAGGGHRRAVVFAVAAKAASLEPSYVNDPTRSTWEASVDDSDGRLRIELYPKALEDPRFAYRKADVPAASHPTIAAAIARLGGAADDDVVWDPFVGSGLELIERARIGPYKTLLGTDVSDDALLAARSNLESAGVTSFSLEKGDSLRARPEGTTLIVTNPPMGRRLVTTKTLDQLLVPFVANAGRCLVRGGRMSWVTPSPKHTDKAAGRAGLVIERALTVDMGGFSAVLQRLVKE